MEKIKLNISQLKDNDKDYLKLLNNHTIIKGNRNSGKTKVMIPLFTSVENGGMYIDYCNESEDILKEICKKNNRTLHIFDNDKINSRNILKCLKEGHFVYFNLRFSNKKDMDNLNEILDILDTEKYKFENKVVIFIENIQFLKEIDSFKDLINAKSSIKLFFSLCYTSQLDSIYGSDFVEKMKNNCNVCKVE